MQKAGNNLKNTPLTLTKNGKLKIFKICHYSCLLILLLALTVRCLIPVGFMPGQGQDGVFSIVICTAMGTETILVDAGNNPVSDHGPDETGNPLDCPFAPVLAQGLVNDAPPVAALQLIYQPVIYDAVPALRLAALPAFYAAQGPPVTFSI